MSNLDLEYNGILTLFCFEIAAFESIIELLTSLHVFIQQELGVQVFATSLAS